MNKDQKQRLILASMIVLGVIYAYFMFVLGPLQDQKKRDQNNIARIEPDIAKAKAQLKKVDDLKGRAPESRRLVDQVNAMIPEGTPVAWFPQQISDFFRKHSVDKVTVKQIADTAEKDLPGYKRITWAFDMPKVEFLSLGSAIADLENSSPLVELQQVEITVSRDDNGAQSALIGASSLNHNRQ